MINTREKFKKAERLCSRKTITSLFEKGNIFYTGFFRVLWSITEPDSPFPARVAFMVPKKGIRLSVGRNLLKRRMREAYRKNKNSLYEFLNLQNIKISFIVIYRKDKIEGYTLLEASIREMIDKMIAEIRKGNSMKTVK